MKIEYYIVLGLFIMLWIWNMARRQTPRRKDKLECLKQYCDVLASSLNTGYPLNGLLLGRFDPLETSHMVYNYQKNDVVWLLDEASFRHKSSPEHNQLYTSPLHHHSTIDGYDLYVSDGQLWVHVDEKHEAELIKKYMNNKNHECQNILCNIFNVGYLT
ncbi:hypothetical protein T081_004748 [Salmonella enterica subsp. enterica serovar Monophasic]|nr:hypothetical protein [Salmonella enterica subsp. enterica serovar Hvittingfoss]EDV9205738.1 hypothetical protein [Salmonella enterica subsp. enterica serovar Monophasic]